MQDDPAPTPLTPSEAVALRAARVWGERPDPGLWDLFPVDRQDALRWWWQTGPSGGPEAIIEGLRREHECQTRPDLARIHVSWWVRALKDEPLSVCAAVISQVPSAVAEALTVELGLTSDELSPDRAADPGAVAVALAGWTDRLVGDVPERDDDPPVIVALTRLRTPSLTRLVREVGLAKWSVSGSRPWGLAPDDVARFDQLQARLSGTDERFRQVAARDLERLDPDDPNAEALLGLTTLARLLVEADPYRVRWALQHIPYSTARSLRSLMGPPGRHQPMLARWETDVLRAGWTLLHERGRIVEPWRWRVPR